jgi:hypothetical protein
LEACRSEDVKDLAAHTSPRDAVLRLTAAEGGIDPQVKRLTLVADKGDKK